MAGPSAKPSDEWDWVSAVWHEIAHVVTLNATNNLISRWFSEGVSVYEEQRFGPSPNSSVGFEFLSAMRENQLLGVADLDNGFMRPQYPGQIGVSYTQAGLLCTFIADSYENGLRRILDVYATTSDTVVAIQEGLGLDPSDLDAAFASSGSKTTTALPQTPSPPIRPPAGPRTPRWRRKTGRRQDVRRSSRSVFIRITPGPATPDWLWPAPLRTAAPLTLAPTPRKAVAKARTRRR